MSFVLSSKFIYTYIFVFCKGQVRFALFSDEVCSITGLELQLTPAVDSFRNKLLASYFSRLGNKKTQFSSPAFLLAIALDPFYKRFILEESHCISTHTTLPPVGTKLKGIFTKTQRRDTIALLRDLEYSAKAAGADNRVSERLAPTTSDNAAYNDPLFAISLTIGLTSKNEVDLWIKETCFQAESLPFWREQRTSTVAKYPRLAAHSLPVYGAPSVNGESERDFSALMLLCAKSRGSLKKQKIARRMLLHQNQDFWDPNPELKKFVMNKKLRYCDLKSMMDETENSSESDDSDSDSV